MNILAGKVYKLRNKAEQGVIAQTAHKQLHDILPDITDTTHFGVMRVDYGLLATAALVVLHYIDSTYHMQLQQKSNEKALVLKDLLHTYQTSEAQVATVRYLALIKMYNERLGITF